MDQFGESVITLTMTFSLHGGESNSASDRQICRSIRSDLGFYDPHDLFQSTMSMHNDDVISAQGNVYECRSYSNQAIFPPLQLSFFSSLRLNSAFQQL